MTDDYLTLAEAARSLPGSPHVSTLHRWRLKGVRGRRLRTTLVGGRRYTRADWLAEFVAERDERGRIGERPARKRWLILRFLAPRVAGQLCAGGRPRDVFSSACSRELLAIRRSTSTATPAPRRSPVRNAPPYPSMKP